MLSQRSHTVGYLLELRSVLHELLYPLILPGKARLPNLGFSDHMVRVLLPIKEAADLLDGVSLGLFEHGDGEYDEENLDADVDEVVLPGCTKSVD
jgi:hypothetical protein